MSKTSVHAKRVLVALSGGIHSAVSAALLKSEGYEVFGLHLELINPSWFDRPEGSAGPRCASSDPKTYEKLQRFCAKLQIPLQKLDARELYEDKVIDHLVHEFMQNRMPHPCLPCNWEVKFASLCAKADQGGYEFVGTGHSARIVHDKSCDRHRVHRATDSARDQSHLLFGLPQKWLGRLLLPVGGLSGGMITQLARQFDYPVEAGSDVSHSGESICYISDGSYKSIIEKRVPVQLRPKGIIRTTESRVAGQHEGLHRHSIGETADSGFMEKKEDLFVLAFEAKSQTLIVGSEKELLRRELLLSGVRWVQPIDGLRGRPCRARFRPYGQSETEASCRVTPFETDTALLRFDEPQRAVPPGQPVTFYDTDELLGGGYVERIGAS